MSHKTNRQIFALPMVLGLATVAGLGAGLIGDGGWDIGAGVLLALPIVVTMICWFRQPAAPRRPRLEAANPVAQ